MCLKFCEDYFGVHIFINMFPSSWKTYPFPGRSNRDTLTHYSTCRQVQISFLGMPQIAHFQVEKWKSSLPWEGTHPLPHPPPARSLRSLGLGRFAPSQKLCPPKCFGSLRHCIYTYSNSAMGIRFADKMLISHILSQTNFIRLRRILHFSLFVRNCVFYVHIQFLITDRL